VLDSQEGPLLHEFTQLVTPRSRNRDPHNLLASELQNTVRKARNEF